MSANVIEVKNLTKQYMKNKVLDDVSFEVKKGAIVGLVGPNGAGKTTIMKTLGGLIFPTEGSIAIYGAKNEEELAQARSRMSFMIEIPYAKEDMSAEENLERQRLQKGIPNKERVKEVLELVGLADTGKKQVKKFSMGMRQRLGIAMSLLVKPEIMVLDEPVNGLDPEGIVEIRELLLKLNKEEQITIIISSHLLAELSLLCTDYVFIHKGKMIKRLTAKQLENECKEYYRIYTTQNALGLTILQNKMGMTNVEVGEDGSIHLFDQLDELEKIVRTLVENDVIPLEMAMHEANLEEYYLNLIQSNSTEEEVDKQDV
ncbi:MAG: ABC transporter ATP-binding protein [Eubacteriales bacterium]|nr:ABC transporter ATP-binding protein [Eubacteriales bacterium]